MPHADSIHTNDLVAALHSLVEGEPNRIANLANAASLLYHTLPDLNWAGFYLRDGDRDELVLGPFQGKPACLRIAFGKGVCGTAASNRTVLNVPDVDAFPGHIACDSDSRSELVVPIIVDGQVMGVLDLDSPRLQRFGDTEAEQVRACVRILESVWNQEGQSS